MRGAEIACRECGSMIFLDPNSKPVPISKNLSKPAPSLPPQGYLGAGKTCPQCSGFMVAYSESKSQAGGCIVAILGFALCVFFAFVGVFFLPLFFGILIIGIPVILYGVYLNNKKEYFWKCSQCGNSLLRLSGDMGDSYIKKAPISLPSIFEGADPVIVGARLVLIFIALFALYLWVGPKTNTRKYATPPASASSKQVNNSLPSESSKGFVPWSGRHIKFSRKIKDGLSDPNSFEHVKTTYFEKGDTLVITMHYKALDSDGLKKQYVTAAEYTNDGNFVEIYFNGLDD